MTVSIWQTPTATPPETVDTVIVGAGIIGSYLALRLREQGRDVLVLDARHAAGGASGRNGGLLVSGIAHSYVAARRDYGADTARDLWALTVRNREAMIGWATRLQTPVRRCGSIVLACNAEQHAELAESAELLRADGFEAQWHADDPLGRGFGGAIVTPSDGAVQAALLTQALLGHSGARLREGAEVYALESQADGVLVRVRGGDVLAREVVVPARGQVLATAPAPRILETTGYCNDGFEYFHQLPDGRFVLGGFRNLAFDEERTWADHTTPLIQDALDAFIARHFRELRDVAVERRWSGTMAFTPDGLPLVGKLPHDPRIACIVACNGHGLGFGLVVADQLLAVLNGGDAGLFGLARVI